jgi:hypothetical protein
VLSTCETWRQGDEPREFSTDDFSFYDDMDPDCGGGWQIWWRQSFPGVDNLARDDDGAPMLSWWPFLFY